MKSKAVPEKDSDGNSIITLKYLKHLCFEQDLYDTPHLNDKLYLHYKGFRKIENLDAYVGLKALWLECNGIRRIEGLGHLTQLRTLYLHQNCIEKIEGLENLTELVTLNISQNRIKKIENLGTLVNLKNFDISNNIIQSSDDLHGLSECPSLTSIDLSNNYIEADEGLVSYITTLENCLALYLRGNPAIRKISTYRKTLVSKMPNLKYLDDRPVFELERLAAEAWLRGGATEEQRVRKEYLEEKRKHEKSRVEAMIGFEEEAKRKKRATLDRIEREARERKAELEKRREELRKVIAESGENDPELNRNILKLRKVEFDITQNEKMLNDDEDNQAVPTAIRPPPQCFVREREESKGATVTEIKTEEDKSQKEEQKQSEVKKKEEERANMEMIKEIEEKLKEEENHKVAEHNKSTPITEPKSKEKQAFKWTTPYETLLEEVLMSNMFDFDKACLDFQSNLKQDFPGQEFDITPKVLQLKWTDIEIRKYRLNNKSAANEKPVVLNSDADDLNEEDLGDLQGATTVSFYNNLEDID